MQICLLRRISWVFVEKSAIIVQRTKVSKFETPLHSRPIWDNYYYRIVRITTSEPCYASEQAHSIIVKWSRGWSKPVSTGCPCTNPVLLHGFPTSMNPQTLVRIIIWMVNKVVLTYREGYAGFHPPRPQDEDVMSQTNVKNGFVIGESVPVSIISSCPRDLQVYESWISGRNV